MQAPKLPNVFYNWTSLVGALIALMSLNIIVLLLVIDAFVQQNTPYLGLLTFLILPVLLVMGLLLVAIGAAIRRQHLKTGTVSRISREIHVDLSNPQHRNAAAIWISGTAFLVLSSASGTYMAYHSTDSVEFCGQVCHEVMSPEFTAYQLSPHARVACTDCHIGPGAEWFVHAKLSGIRQIFATIGNSYPRPIPTPIEHLRPARETCEQCHWPEQSFGSRQDNIPHFLADEENTSYPISMLVHVGNGDGEDGVHWHVAKENKVEYIARDRQRLDIPWVRMTGPSGKDIIYQSVDDPLSEEEIAALPKRIMDCMDCHNRPSHIYKSPNRTVNAALAKDRLDRELPYVKMQAITLLDVAYEDTVSALAAIDEGMRTFYDDEYPDIVEDMATSIDQAVATTQQIYRENMFPEMKVSWRQYPDHIGHSEYLGCFRCHGEKLENEDGENITGNCNTCHTIIAQGEDIETGLISATGLEFVHPEDIDGEELEMPCSDCHEGGAEQY